MPDLKKKPSGKTSLNRRPRRFHFIDIVILVLILAVVGVALYAYLPGFLSGFSGSRKTVEYTVIFEEPLDEVSFHAIASDNTVISNKSEFGKVKSAEIVPETEILNSNIKRTEEQFTVRAVISADAEVTDTAVKVGGVSLRIGETYRLVLPGYSGTAVVTDIRIGG